MDRKFVDDEGSARRITDVTAAVKKRAMLVCVDVNTTNCEFFWRQSSTLRTQNMIESVLAIDDVAETNDRNDDDVYEHYT